MHDKSTPSTSDDNAPAFGGEKAKDMDAASGLLPDEHANSTAHRTADDKIVAAEFSGLDNDLVDLGDLDHQPSDEEDDGLGPVNEDEDQPGLPGETDVDETSAGGLMFPDEKATG